MDGIDDPGRGQGLFQVILCDFLNDTVDETGAFVFLVDEVLYLGLSPGRQVTMSVLLTMLKSSLLIPAIYVSVRELDKEYI